MKYLLPTYIDLRFRWFRFHGEKSGRPQRWMFIYRDPENDTAFSLS